MLRQYETVFIMTPVLSDEQMKETVSKFREYLKNKGAEIVYEDHWGLRKMAYPIQKKSTGFYHLIEFKAEPEIIRGFDVELKRDERVIRFLTMSLDKHAIAYNEKKRREKEASVEQEKEQEKQAENN
ncbi:MAG: 30S ribosomal protein S6 [Bacteroidales bacterium]|nr:30S ribosomal protein S6 [Bacteroidales bacterium]